MSMSPCDDYRDKTGFSRVCSKEGKIDTDITKAIIFQAMALELGLFDHCRIENRDRSMW
jgi:hypothetical protein